MNTLGDLSVLTDSSNGLAERLTQSGSNKDLSGVAEQFESLFISMMLKSMRQAMSQDMFAGDKSDTFGGLFDTFMAQHLAENGGFGLTSLFKQKTAETGPVEQAGSKLQPQHLEAYQDAIAIGKSSSAT